jgi:hypothetical protein
MWRSEIFIKTLRLPEAAESLPVEGLLVLTVCDGEQHGIEV